jgi:hypothetical protein
MLASNRTYVVLYLHCMIEQLEQGLFCRTFLVLEEVAWVSSTRLAYAPV